MKNGFKKSSGLTAALSLLLGLQAVQPARAGWLLWEGPPAPVPAPAAEKAVASPRAALESLLPAEICAPGRRGCASASTVFSGGETSLRAFIAAAGFEPADRSFKNVFFSGLKGLYSGRPGSGLKLAPRREYRGRPQDISFASGNGCHAYAWRLPFRSAAGPLWLVYMQPLCPLAWDKALKEQKEARAVKARAASQEFLIVTLP
jgi:hypothetical protein